MAEEVARPRLGRGLAALIGDFGEAPVQAGADRKAGPQRRVAIEFLRPNPRNPRRTFADAELEELAASIRTRGVIQPIVVRAVAGVPDAFEIVAGERRWRASQRAGLHDVPVVVVEVDDRTSLEYAILENVQRADLNAIEEAAGYERLMSEFRYTQTELAEIIGKSRSHLANTLRLLQLPPGVQEHVVAGRLTAGHARALLSVRDPDAVARRVIDEGMTVRDVEALAAEHNAAAGPRPGRPRKAPAAKDADTRALERRLEDLFGLAVSIEARGEGGEVRLRYGSLDQLDELCRRLEG
ncbi:ParB/RepB/Spo0J family partition protein [uncultured Methylobacterium sp.]|uniref:ParB/RepB/Spo0J family partition protein n=1 Tax=uncultured Methylobacterium sp. TaxID=157278 RepID=UPI00263209A0|nr:ParB/RepB/Spo0J family partition protein [uncultured Methylobacterium sp.]